MPNYEFSCGPPKELSVLPPKSSRDPYRLRGSLLIPALSGPREIDFERDLEISSRDRRSQIHSRARSCILPRWLSYGARGVRGRRCILRNQRILDYEEDRRGDCNRHFLLPKFLHKPSEAAISRSVRHRPGHLLSFITRVRRRSFQAVCTIGRLDRSVGFKHFLLD